jgi:hypothetical protein
MIGRSYRSFELMMLSQRRKERKGYLKVSFHLFIAFSFAFFAPLREQYFHQVTLCRF